MNEAITNTQVYDKLDQIPANLLQSCRPIPMPQMLLMCPPEYFDVVDIKNPHMQGNIGKVDPSEARRQWEAVRRSFLDAEATVHVIDPLPGCEDMVFCANQTFVGTGADGQKLCLLSQMKHPSRQREVAAFGQWFSQHGYRQKELPGKIAFEGSGDAIWHPGRGLVWGGTGFRSQPAAYTHLSEFFGVPVIRLPLKSERFYHLDTCFAAIDERTVLLHPGALTDEGLAMIGAVFENVIECDDAEANELMACNATALGGRHVVIQEGCRRAIAALRKMGYTVHEVNTSEYMKSGGSVFCMKMYEF